MQFRIDENGLIAIGLVQAQFRQVVTVVVGDLCRISEPASHLTPRLGVGAEKRVGRPFHLTRHHARHCTSQPPLVSADSESRIGCRVDEVLLQIYRDEAVFDAPYHRENHWKSNRCEERASPVLTNPACSKYKDCVSQGPPLLPRPRRDVDGKRASVGVGEACGARI
eukprot:scaffold77399_cov76-Phaeocystis_antarctica.AAC.4